MLLWMLSSMPSTTVNTEMMEKIPMVIPSSDKNVRNLFALKACNAKSTLSRNNFINILNCNTAQRYVYYVIGGYSECATMRF